MTEKLLELWPVQREVALLCEHGRLEQDFAETNAFRAHTTYSCEFAKKFPKQNRYRDVLPYDHSRVKLDEVPYINASYITGDRPCSFIAAQGPMPLTVGDFYAMIYWTRAEIVVSLSNPADNSGCYQYWPEDNETIKVKGSDIKVKVERVTSNKSFIIREMVLTVPPPNAKGEASDAFHSVTHYQYIAWPDRSVPDLHSLINLVEVIRDSRPTVDSPIVVHCAAGCGRTGTFIATYIVINAILDGKVDKRFKIKNLVRRLRKERCNMVQTLEQYELIYEAASVILDRELRSAIHSYENLPIRPDESDAKSKSKEEPDTQYLEDHLPEREEIVPVEYALERPKTPDNPSVFQNDGSLESSRAKDAIGSSKQSPTIRHVPASKLEKDAENMSQKNRIAATLVLPSETQTSQPKIAKLRALFETKTTHPKAKVSVVRSHSFSTIRTKSVFSLNSSQGSVDSECLKPSNQPPASEVKAQNVKAVAPVKPPRADIKKKRMTEPQSSRELPITSGGKLKIPKMSGDARSAIKRSKSLIIQKETTPFLTLLKQATTENGYENLPEQSSLKRSFDSLVGDIDESSSKPKSSVMQQFQMFSSRTVSSLTSGWSLGIRERRNSFRQAMNRREAEIKDQFGSHGRFVYVPKEVPVNNLTVKAQNGEVLTPKHGNRSSLYGRITKPLSSSLSTPIYPSNYQNTRYHTSNASKSRPNPATNQTNSVIHPMRHKSISPHSSGSSETPSSLPHKPHSKLSSQSMRLPSSNKFLTRLRNEFPAEDLESPRVRSARDVLSLEREGKPRRVDDAIHEKNSSETSQKVISSHKKDSDRKLPSHHFNGSEISPNSYPERLPSKNLAQTLPKNQISEVIPRQTSTVSAVDRRLKSRSVFDFGNGPKFSLHNAELESDRKIKSKSVIDFGNDMKLSPRAIETGGKAITPQSATNGTSPNWWSDKPSGLSDNTRTPKHVLSSDVSEDVVDGDFRVPRSSGLVLSGLWTANDPRRMAAGRHGDDGSESSGSSGARELHRVMSTGEPGPSNLTVRIPSLTPSRVTQLRKTPPRPLSSDVPNSLNVRQPSPKPQNSLGVDVDSVAASLRFNSISSRNGRMYQYL